MSNRLAALEGKASPTLVEKWHDVVAKDDQTEDEALNAYGREKIGPNDSVIIFRSVTPRFDEDGKMIRPRDWPAQGSDA